MLSVKQNSLNCKKSNSQYLPFHYSDDEYYDDPYSYYDDYYEGINSPPPPLAGTQTVNIN